jgi:archaeal type IV pilus assembly protein PilA
VRNFLIRIGQSIRNNRKKNRREKMKYIKNEEAVSPVIGVILMVVITVIIAAILAVFSFGIGGPQKSPEVNLKYTASVDATAGSILKISHEGGDALILKDEKMTVTFASNGNDAITAAAPPAVPVSLDNAAGGWNTVALDTLAAGQTIEGGLDASAIVGTILEVKIVDTPTGQLISKSRVVVQ